MSIVVWDGKNIACDRQGDMNGTMVQVKKWYKHGSTVLAWTGGQSDGWALVGWYLDDHQDKNLFPSFQSDRDRWVRMIIAEPGKCSIIEQSPFLVPVKEKFFAWGSGMDIALGALEMGANAKRAAEIACKYITTCGMGVDVIRVK